MVDFRKETMPLALNAKQHQSVGLALLRHHKDTHLKVPLEQCEAVLSSTTDASFWFYEERSKEQNGSCLATAAWQEKKGIIGKSEGRNSFSRDKGPKRS